MEVLDVGCGIFQRGTINADLYQKNAIDKSRFVRCDAHHLPFRTRIFNKVLCYHTLEHLECPAKALNELMRVARSIVHVRVPYRYSLSAKSDATHRHIITETWFKKYARAKVLKIKSVVRWDNERDLRRGHMELSVWLWRV